jgi:large subunit ribosomal protein L20
MRVKRGNVNRKRHKKVLKLTKGYKGGRSKIFVAAMQAMMHGLKRAYRGRKLKKRNFRALWIQRINAAANELGLSYSKLMNGLKEANIDLNRKMLAQIAVEDKNAFAKLVELAKTKYTAA